MKRLFTGEDGSPRPVFGTLSGAAMVVGIVVGIGIFRFPSDVAENSASGLHFLLFWGAGGIISLLGALCYAELATTYPDTGGEYTYLTRAYGASVGALFSWGRLTVIQTGSLALAAFILGDYATILLDLGTYSSSIYAGCTVIFLTGLNLTGTRHSKRVQNILTGGILLLLLTTAGAAFCTDPHPGGYVHAPDRTDTGAPGMAMIFILLTYGGWNEAVYLSREVKDRTRGMLRMLIISIVMITIVYLLVNMAYLHVLGFEALREADTVGASLTREVFGEWSTVLTSGIVILAALSTSNATIVTGARTNYAWGRDFPLLRFLGRWDRRRNTPANALIVQGVIALLLVVLGAATGETVSTMVDYTAPVFWAFFCLSGCTLFVFRWREPQRDRPFQVPLYPVIPSLFILTTLYMLYSSLTYTGVGALAGVGILLAGIPLLWFNHLSERKDKEQGNA